MPCRDKPTELDRQVYGFIDQYWKQNNVPPSVMEVRNGTGNPSSAVVECCLERLVESGLLVKAKPPTPAWVKQALEDCQ